MYLRNSSYFSSKQIQIIILILLQVSLSNQFRVDKDLQHGDINIQLNADTQGVRNTLFPALKKTDKVLPLVSIEDPAKALNPESRDATKTSRRTGHKELDLQGAIRNYTGWRIIRVYPPAPDVFENLVQTLEGNAQIVVLEAIRGKSMVCLSYLPVT